ncbi:VOC family protein [Rhodococcus chondri]|uniref:VOC family protein n=1 Tax=Rhodococcus chondri TaxID=3065941 RepID=A0ABU7JUH1_9NOCA|nr:VOC family protein [Rhodococcus sp. CC-R104]MEE2033673.1 VOC family protein [Rhodococcus sp. CC-R104]
MPKLTPWLWFDMNAEDAAEFYTSVFPNSRIGKITRYIEGAPVPAGTVMTVEMILDGQTFYGLNGGPQFPFTEAVSFQIDCDSQDEVDYYWKTLTEGGGEESQCGWCKDKFGLSWQVVPRQLDELLDSPDPAVVERVTAAMMKMRKIEVPELEAAARG